jgi:hypothetical protein
VSFNESTRESANLRALPHVNKPVDISPEEYERRLWEDTDRSLRRSPERWVRPSVGDLSFATAGRAGESQETGLRAYVDDSADLAAVRAEVYRENAKRKQAAQKAAATKRARSQAQAPADSG